MNRSSKHFLAIFLGTILCTLGAAAQTDGGARLEVTLSSYSGSATHWTAVWVTTENNTFIKTLWKQGTKYGWTSSQWSTHMTTWNTARAGNTNVDGYTSATATSYSGVNSPVILTWNCKDQNGALVPDGKYKFWVQYAEDTSSQGPYTTSGLLWTKGPAGATNTFANQGANFTAMKVTWSPKLPITIGTVKAQGNQIIMSGTGPANGSYYVLVSDSASGTVWNSVATNSFDAAGTFRWTNVVQPGVAQRYYRLRTP